MTHCRLTTGTALLLCMLLTLALTLAARADGPNPPEPESRAVFSDFSAGLDAGSARRTPEAWTKLVRKWESKFRAINDDLSSLVLELNESADASKAPTSELAQLREESRARRQLTTELARLVLMEP